MVLSLSNDVRPLEINLMVGLWSLCRETKFLITFPYVHVRDESPLGTQKFNLIQRTLDAKLENSKLGRVGYKISLRFVLFSKVIISV